MTSSQRYWNGMRRARGGNKNGVQRTQRGNGEATWSNVAGSNQEPPFAAQAVSHNAAVRRRDTTAFIHIIRDTADEQMWRPARAGIKVMGDERRNEVRASSGENLRPTAVSFVRRASMLDAQTG